MQGEEFDEAQVLSLADLDRAATLTIEAYGPQILGYLTALVGDHDDAADVFSSFSEDLWKGLPGFRRECSLKTWSYKLAWHAMQRFRRELHRVRGQRLRTSAAAQLADRIRTTTAIHLQTAVKDRVAALRSQLEPDDQSILILRIDRQLSWREVAHVLSTAEHPVDDKALRKRFERLKSRLRELARKEGLLDSDERS